jgi:hypothetical protein
MRGVAQRGRRAGEHLAGRGLTAEAADSDWQDGLTTEARRKRRKRGEGKSENGFLRASAVRWGWGRRPLPDGSGSG